MTGSATTKSRIDHWAAAPPLITGVLTTDAAALRAFTADGEDLLADLPAKPDRDPEDALDTTIHQRSRQLRAAFMRVHADAVHATVTDGGKLPLRLPELAFRAADEFTGLVPTATQMAAESAYGQGDKEGREIDQGIFFSALLSSATAGRQVLDAMRLPTPRALELLERFQRTGVAQVGCVDVERRGDAAHLTVRNLHCLNAEDTPSVDDMETAVDLALLDGAVKVGVVRGGEMSHHKYRGRRVFSSGINLKDLHEGRISFVDFLLRREIGYISKLFHGLLMDPTDWTGGTVSKPWVAGVDSFAIGGGAQLLLVFDQVVAAADSYFSVPAAQEGIVPGAANLRLARQAGPRLARQVILCGRKIFATDPEARLLFDEVTDPATLDDAVECAAERMAAPAVAANRRMLNLAEEPLDDFREYLAEFALQQAVRAYAPDVIHKTARWSTPA